MVKMIKSWKRGFDAAHAAATHSNGSQPGLCLGAALFDGPRILSRGFNTWGKTTPYTRHASYLGNVHAEASCLIHRKYYDNPKNLTLYVVRQKTNSRHTIRENVCSRPCKSCMELIKQFNIKRIRFYDTNGNPAEMEV
jgi:deoxycytidylate deaminase